GVNEYPQTRQYSQTRKPAPISNQPVVTSRQTQSNESTQQIGIAQKRRNAPTRINRAPTNITSLHRLHLHKQSKHSIQPGHRRKTKKQKNQANQHLMRSRQPIDAHIHSIEHQNQQQSAHQRRQRLRREQRPKQQPQTKKIRGQK